MRKLIWLTAVFLLPLSVCHAQLTAEPPTLVSAPIPPGTVDAVSGKSAVAPNFDAIVFSSRMSNLVAGDTNKAEDIFLSENGVNSLITRSETGAQANSDSFDPAISAKLTDGSYAIAYASTATNLLRGYSAPTTGSCAAAGCSQVFLTLMPSGASVLVSRGRDANGPLPLAGGSGSSKQPSVAILSATNNKILVSFLSDAPNLAVGSSAGLPKISPFLATILVVDGIPVVDTVETINPPPDADCFDLILSGDGSYGAMSTAATNVVPGSPGNGFRQIVLFNYASHLSIHLSKNSAGELGNGDSTLPSFSYRGDVRGFVTTATNLIYGVGGLRSPVFVLHSKSSGGLAQINTSSAGVPSDGAVGDGRLSANGFYAAFSDTASNLAGLTGNFAKQTYMKNLLSGELVLLSKNVAGEAGSRNSYDIFLGAAGFTSLDAIASFTTFAFNLVGDAGSFLPVLRSDITIPPPPLVAGVEISAPPDITVAKRSATVDLQKFSLVGTTGQEAHASAARVTYNVEIRKTGVRGAIVRTTSRNRITVRRLSPGRYTVRYRVTGSGPSGTIKSKYSPKGAMVIQ